MAIRARKRNEIALGIDDHLLDLARALLEHPAQQMRLARAGIALDKQTRREELLKIDQCRPPGTIESHVHL